MIIEKVDLSVVIPLKDESEGLAVLFERLVPILKGLGRSFEIICVNDGSTDATLAALIGIQRNLPELVVVDLSRNFGKEAALVAGLVEARGEAVIPIDADLQDPPELIPEMVEAWQAGAEVVLAVRRRRSSDTFFKRATASAFYNLLNKLGEIEIPAHAGDFRLMTRPVVDALAQLPERNRFNKGLFAWLGFHTVVVEYERPKRHAGTSKWAFKKLWSLAVDGITAFSSLPLKIWTFVGLMFALVAVLYGFYLVLRYFLTDSIDVPGYSSLMVAILFSSGVVLTGLGVIGEYISRIYTETKARPLYLVRKVHRS